MLEIVNLSCFYGKTRVLGDINLEFEDGKFYAVIGKNSSGKSTLMNCICAIKRHEGSINFDGRDIKSFSDRERAGKVSYLSQNVRSVSFTVRDLCSFGRNAFGDSRDECEKRVWSALERVGILHLADKKVSAVSGGERQLAYFAMNLCQDSDIMLLDEPTSNLDAENEASILSTAKNECRNGKTVICVIHNLSLALKYADGIVILEGGKCVFAGSREECLEREIIEECFNVKKYNANGEIFFAV